MAYPTDSLSKIQAEIDVLMIQTKRYAQAASAQMGAGAVTASVVMQARYTMKSTISRLDQLKTTPGLVEYARTEKNDGTLDVVAEFNSAIAAMQAVVNFVEANFPKDADGYLLKEKWDANGPDVVQRSFTPAQLATLRGNLDSVAAAIN